MSCTAPQRAEFKSVTHIDAGRNFFSIRFHLTGTRGTRFSRGPDMIEFLLSDISDIRPKVRLLRTFKIKQSAAAPAA
jgi:hypothetical protein